MVAAWCIGRTLGRTFPLYWSDCCFHFRLPFLFPSSSSSFQFLPAYQPTVSTRDTVTKGHSKQKRGSLSDVFERLKS